MHTCTVFRLHRVSWFPLFDARKRTPKKDTSHEKHVPCKNTLRIAPGRTWASEFRLSKQTVTGCSNTVHGVLGCSIARAMLSVSSGLVVFQPPSSLRAAPPFFAGVLLCRFMLLLPCHLLLLLLLLMLDNFFCVIGHVLFRQGVTCRSPFTHSIKFM